MNPKPVAVVSGASSGIGRSVVLKLLQMGYSVHGLARRLDAMADLASKGAILHRLDLRDPSAISAFVRELVTQHGRIDVLINNAGYGAYGAVEEVDLKAAREQIEVNLFAPAQLIKETLPTMRAQRSGKILNVSSIGGKVWSPLGAWYHAAKFGLEGFSDALRNEVRPFGIDVIVIEPGGIKTEWSGIAVKNMLQNSSSGPYREIAEAFATLSTSPQAEKMAAPPQVIADLIAKALLAAKPKARYVAPFSGKVILFLRYILSDRMFDLFFCKAFRIPKTLGQAESV